MGLKGFKVLRRGDLSTYVREMTRALEISDQVARERAGGNQTLKELAPYAKTETTTPTSASAEVPAAVTSRVERG